MRVPRRTFATPFVLTLALPLGACVVDSSPRGGTAPNPPPAQTEPATTPAPHHDPVVVANPPRPVEPKPPEPPAPQPPRPIVMNPPRPQPVPQDTGAKFDQHWTVSRQGATCNAFNDDACRMPNRKPNDPIPPCNPPMPTAYKCPADLADHANFKIIKHAGETQCFVDEPPFKCPANAKCKPWTPRVADCP
jgi:hypothetical protein